MRRQFRLAVALAAAGFLTAAAAPANAELLISVDKSTQTMTVNEDGATLYTWPVSTGVARYDTPSGDFKPFRMEMDHFSREWDDAPMPYSIFFTMKGHAIHGTNHKIDGAAHSHGCVRLSVAHAATLWALVKKNKMANTRVVLTGTVEDAPPAVAHGNAPAPVPGGNGEFNRTYSTDDLPGAGTEAAPPARQRVIGGWRETTDGNVYVYERPRGLFQPPPRPVGRRYYVVPGDGYEVPPPRYYYRYGR